MPPQSRLGRVEDKAGGAIGIAAAVRPHAAATGRAPVAEREPRRQRRARELRRGLRRPLRDPHRDRPQKLSVAAPWAMSSCIAAELLMLTPSTTSFSP